VVSCITGDTIILVVDHNLTITSPKFASGTSAKCTFSTGLGHV